jgi:Uma2 family endonuclease
MATGTLVTLEEYLHADYEVDCDYVDGVIEERNVGEYDHSRLQGAFVAFLYAREKQWKIRVLPEQRVRVKATRFRIPDVCVILEPGPFEPIIQVPPFICIEILSPEDRTVRTQKRIDDYLAFGVRYVWLIDPSTRRAFVYRSEGSYEAKDGILRTENPEMIVPLAEIFASLE